MLIDPYGIRRERISFKLSQPVIDQDRRFKGSGVFGFYLVSGFRKGGGYAAIAGCERLFPGLADSLAAIRTKNDGLRNREQLSGIAVVVDCAVNLRFWSLRRGSPST